MTLDKNKKNRDNDTSSLGTIGGKIRRYRELKGLTQKQLGMKCGFGPTTAEIRLSQYESNKREPRDSMMAALIEALDLDENVLLDVDLRSRARMYQALFEIEDLHGLHPVRIGDDYYLEFSGPRLTSSTEVLPSDYRAFLEKWFKKRQEFGPRSSDTPEVKAEKEREYALWKGGYPSNEAENNMQIMMDAVREHQLQAELDALYAKRNNEPELKRIDSAIEAFIPEAKESMPSISSGAELISLIKKTAYSGLPIDHNSPEVKLEEDPDHCHLFSVKSEDITKDDASKRLYARLVCAIEALQSQGIQLSQRITSRDKVLYVTYEYPYEQYEYFEKADE